MCHRAETSRSQSDWLRRKRLSFCEPCMALPRIVAERVDVVVADDLIEEFNAAQRVDAIGMIERSSLCMQSVQRELS